MSLEDTQHIKKLNELTSTENNYLMNLGAVVVAQQIVQPSSPGKTKP